MANQVFRRYFTILKDQLRRRRPAHAAFSQLAAHRKAGEILFHNKSADALGTPLGRGLGIDQQRIGRRPVGDEHLAAVKDILVALLHRPRLEPHGIGAGPRFGQCQRPDLLADHQRW